MAKWSLFSHTDQKKSKVRTGILTAQLARSLRGLRYPSCHVFLRLGPPGERAKRFCGLQHGGPPDPLGLVRELQPALPRHGGWRARSVHTHTHTLSPL